jgi:hypothetical protein
MFVAVMQQEKQARPRKPSGIIPQTPEQACFREPGWSRNIFEDQGGGMPVFYSDGPE